MAQVWLAQDESLERLVALKRLRREYAQDATLLARFRREAKTIARLNSPYIVQIYDVGMNESDSFIVMEYVEGQDLKKLLELKGPLSVAGALNLMRDIITGVAIAHEAGLIHRDLKPANILISKRGQIKITDFGIARDLAKRGMTQPGTVWGTSDYMAPEQAMGQSASPAMDVYSLGVLMFEILSGKLPYPGNDPMVVMMAHIQKPVPSLHRVAPLVPKNLSNLVARMMAKNPTSRPQDGVALLKILNNYNRLTQKTTSRSNVTKRDQSQTGDPTPADQSDLSTHQIDTTAPPTSQWDQSDARTGRLVPPPTPPVPPSDAPTGQIGTTEQPTPPVDKSGDLGTPPPASSVDQSQASTRHWQDPTPPLRSDQSDAATRHWGEGTPGSQLERREGPTRHWPTTPPPSTIDPSDAGTRHWGEGTPGSQLERTEGPTRNWPIASRDSTIEQSQSATPDTSPPFTKDKSEAATRQAGAAPSPAEKESSWFMVGGGVVMLLLLLCLFISMANRNFRALIGANSGTQEPLDGNVPITEIAVEASFTATPTEAPPTATPTVEASATEATLIEPATVEAGATASATVEASATASTTATVEAGATASATVEVSATATATVEASATATTTVEPSATATLEPSPIPPTATKQPSAYPYPEPNVTPTRISGPRVGNGPDAYAQRLQTDIDLDGYLFDWDINEPVYLERMVNRSTRWRGPRDLSGIAYFSWDDDYLYLAVERTDNEHLQTRTGHELYRDDSIELWIDFDMYGDLEVPDANEDDYQFVFSAGDFENIPPEGVTYYPDRADYQLEVNAVPLFRGYILEARIPWNAVGVFPYEQMVLGYAVILNDNDSPQEDEPKTQVASNRQDSYLNPYAFGNLILLP